MRVFLRSCFFRVCNWILLQRFGKLELMWYILKSLRSLICTSFFSVVYFCGIIMQNMVIIYYLLFLNYLPFAESCRVRVLQFLLVTVFNWLIVDLNFKILKNWNTWIEQKLRNTGEICVSCNPWSGVNNLSFSYFILKFESKL